MTEKSVSGRLILTVLTLVLVLAVASCSSVPLKSETVDVPPDDPVFTTIVAKIDALCAALDGKRDSGPERTTRITHGNYTSFACWSIMSVAGRTETVYRFEFDQDLSLREFWPQLPPPGVGIGFDTVEDNETREKIMGTIRDFGRHISFKFYEGPFIQLVQDSYYIASFYSLPKEVLKKRHPIDPYVTFFITKDMKVFGIFWGA